MNAHNETRVKECEDCGETFEYDHVARADGRPMLIPPRCWRCVERRLGEEVGKIHQRDERRRETAWHQWVRMFCPSLLDIEKYLMDCDRRIRQAAAAWSQSLPTERGLGLIGPTGSGKTVCSVLALREAHFQGNSVAFVDATTLAEAANLNRWGQREEKTIARLDIERWRQASYLLLDDIGQAAANANEDADALLFDLVKFRTEQSRAIIWTCQGPDGWLRQRLGPVRYPAITRRLLETCDVTSLFSQEQQELTALVETEFTLK